MHLHDHLFVYGTLMRNCTSELGRIQRRRLVNESEYVAQATVLGWLYDMGSFPALRLEEKQAAVSPDQEIDQRAKAKVITGEVIRLLSPRVTLPWLDLYEGVDEEDRLAEALYFRTRTQVLFDTGGQLTAWLYAAKRIPAHKSPMTQGQWNTTKSKRQKFSIRSNVRRN